MFRYRVVQKDPIGDPMLLERYSTLGHLIQNIQFTLGTLCSYPVSVLFGNAAGAIKNGADF